MCWNSCMPGTYFTWTSVLKPAPLHDLRSGLRPRKGQLRRGVSSARSKSAISTGYRPIFSRPTCRCRVQRRIGMGVVSPARLSRLGTSNFEHAQPPSTDPPDELLEHRNARCKAHISMLSSIVATTQWPNSPVMSQCAVQVFLPSLLLVVSPARLLSCSSSLLLAISSQIPAT